MRGLFAVVAAVIVFAGGCAFCFSQPNVVIREAVCPAMAEFVDALPSEMPETVAELEPKQFCAALFEKGFVRETNTGVEMVGVTADGLVLGSRIALPVGFVYSAEAVRRSEDTVSVELQRMDAVVVVLFFVLACVTLLIVVAI